MKLRERKPPPTVNQGHVDLRTMDYKKKPDQTPKQTKRCYWSRAEKRKLATALKKEISNDRKLSSSATFWDKVDLSELQRHVPARSQQEISDFIESCLASEEEKDKREREQFASSNLNKWVQLCAKCQSRPPIVEYDGTLSPDEACCYSTLFNLSNNQPSGQPSLLEGNPSELSRLSDYIPNYSVINEVLASLFTAGNTCINPIEKLSNLEALVLVQLIDDIEGKIESGMSGVQEDHVFQLYKSLQASPVPTEADPGQKVPEEQLSSPYDSQALNPLRFDSSSCQVAHSTVPFKYKS